MEQNTSAPTTASRNTGLKSDRFEIKGFDHLEFWSLDAKTAAHSLKVGTGLEIVAHSQHETGNHLYSSYVMTSGPGIKWTVVAPYLSEFEHPVQTCPHPNFDKEFVKNWVVKHGVGVAVIGLLVDNATEAYNLATGVGLEGTDWAKGRTPPTEVKAEKGSMVVSEIFIYGETILRFVQYKDGYDGIFLPGYKSFKDPAPFDYGIKRMDHVVGNVWELEPVINNLKKWLGFHVFAFFTKEEIQTEYTSLNSTVMANNYDTVLMPINEPAKKKRESQITEFLKANNGPGVQHIALFTHDIIATIEKMVAVQQYGGFELIPTPAAYYNDPEIVKIMNEHLTPPVIEAVKKFGILVDKDVEGVLLQIFTKPLFDRPTLFVEIIQRICKGEIVDKAGCGGFGKGNFRALFESIERMQAERDMLLEDN